MHVPKKIQEATLPKWQMHMQLSCECGQLRDVGIVYRPPPGVDYRKFICPACQRVYTVTGWSDTGPVTTLLGVEIWTGRSEIVSIEEKLRRKK